jgi:hypothetical protein
MTLGAAGPSIHPVIHAGLFGFIPAKVNCAHKSDDHQVILGTQKLRLSAASFRTWRGSAASAARDPVTAGLVNTMTITYLARDSNRSLFLRQPILIFWVANSRHQEPRDPDRSPRDRQYMRQRRLRNMLGCDQGRGTRLACSEAHMFRDVRQQHQLGLLR